MDKKGSYNSDHHGNTKHYKYKYAQSFDTYMFKSLPIPMFVSVMKAII